MRHAPQAFAMINFFYIIVFLLCVTPFGSLQNVRLCVKLSEYDILLSYSDCVAMSYGAGATSEVS